MKLWHWYDFPAGMAPVLIGMCFLGSVQIFFIGLVGEYILSINSRVMKRPLVVEEERLNFDEKSDMETGNAGMKRSDADSEKSSDAKPVEPDVKSDTDAAGNSR